MKRKEKNLVWELAGLFPRRVAEGERKNNVGSGSHEISADKVLTWGDQSVNLE